MAEIANNIDGSAGDESGFTLVELSIVLVIIGLIVGGVLVGHDLITAAGIRSTIAQLEKYNQAVNTFRGKYGQLPGDIDANTAAAFGFTARGPYAGMGDGNGVIQGVCGFSQGANCGEGPFTGETGAFWVDLTTANGLNLNLIDQAFSLAAPSENGGDFGTAVTGTGIDGYLPAAKMGKGNYIYVWSGGTIPGVGVGDGNNYFGLSAVSALGGSIGWAMHSVPGLSVKEAYNIDSKIDDGLPQSGRVLARYYEL